MADEQAVIKRMEQYAKAAARKVMQKSGLGQDENQHEDISQTLFLAGWEVCGATPAAGRRPATAWSTGRRTRRRRLAKT
jgi:hypothetical protein